MRLFSSSILARRINSLQQLDKISSTAEALLEPENVGNLLAPGAELCHPRDQLCRLLVIRTGAGIYKLIDPLGIYFEHLARMGGFAFAG